jgi:hypothetical protein
MLARVRTVLHAGALDRRIGDGARPSSDPALAARSARLVRCSTRMEVADALASACAAAHDPANRRALSAVPLAATDVVAAQPELDALIARLRAPEPVLPQGVALAYELLVDGSGPLYARQHSDGGEALARAAVRATVALETGAPWC